MSEIIRNLACTQERGDSGGHCKEHVGRLEENLKPSQNGFLVGSLLPEQEPVRQREANAEPAGVRSLPPSFTRSRALWWVVKDSLLKTFKFCVRFTYKTQHDLHKKYWKFCETDAMGTDRNNNKRLTWSGMLLVEKQNIRKKYQKKRTKNSMQQQWEMSERWVVCKTTLWAPRLVNKEVEEVLEAPGQRFACNPHCSL